jgi:hypothetical protein
MHQSSEAAGEAVQAWIRLQGFLQTAAAGSDIQKCKVIKLCQVYKPRTFDEWIAFQVQVAEAGQPSKSFKVTVPQRS